MKYEFLAGEWLGVGGWVSECGVGNLAILFLFDRIWCIIVMFVF